MSLSQLNTNKIVVIIPPTRANAMALITCEYDSDLFDLAWDRLSLRLTHHALLELLDEKRERLHEADPDYQKNL